MTVSVRLFAVLRERAGADSVELKLEEGATVADALEAIAAQHALGDLLNALPVVLAVNRDYATADERLVSGDELALIPPISGGTTEVHARVSDSALSLDGLSRAVRSPLAGAIVIFQGVTREVESLVYEAYKEMAEERIAAILEDCVQRHGLEAAAAEHRTGRVKLGEPGVIVATSAAHRAEAFAGAREALDRIKAEAPIWKREVTEQQSRWVDGHTPAVRVGPPKESA